jgi:PST family polysaccharide transporter
MVQDKLKAKLFGRHSDSASLGRRAAIGGIAVMTGEVGTAVVRLTALAFLARLLSPEDFGLVAMVTALTVFAERFKDMGLTDATVQAESISHEETSNLFWLNTTICVGIAIVIAALSPVIARFYGESRLVTVTFVIAATFAISGIVIQHQALLRRRMHFRSVTIVGFAGVLLSQLAAIGAAVAGLGYWSLVLREVVRALITAIGTILVLPWRPGLPSRSAGSMRRFLRFGRDVTGYNIVVFLSRNLDKILLGRLFGAGAVGLYVNAYKTLSLPVTQVQYPVNSVALPTLSTVQSERDRFNIYFLRMIGLLTFLTMPIVLFVALFSELAVRIVLGDQWLAAIPILQALAIGSFFEPIAQAVGPAMVAIGDTKRYFRLGLISSVILVLGLALGSIWGATGAALGRSAAILCSVALALTYGLRKTPVNSPDLLLLSLRTASLALISGGIILLVRHLLGWELPMGVLIALAMAGIPTYLLLWYTTPNSRHTLRTYLFYFRKVLTRA